MKLFKSKTLFITTICLLFSFLNTFAQNPKQIEKAKHWKLATVFGQKVLIKMTKVYHAASIKVL